MLNDQQIERIDTEKIRLKELLARSKGDLETYVQGRIDSLQWIKENL